MLRHVIYSFAFVLSFTTAQAETPENYFGVSAIIDGELQFDDPGFVDSNFNSGFILSFGHQIQDQVSVEIAHAKYADNSSGYLESELTAWEISGLFHFPQNGPFIRLGYSDGKLTSTVIDLDTGQVVGNISGSDSGVIFGVGYDIPISQDTGILRLEYGQADYDDGEVTRLTLGTLIRF